MNECVLHRPGAGGEVAVVAARKACRYHRPGESYPAVRMTPDGLCPFAFHLLYPDCLAMLSRGRYPVEGGREICRLQCPFAGEGVEFGVFRIPRKRTFFGKLELLARKTADLFTPVELLEYGIAIEVTKAGAGCPHKYRAGDMFEMNIKGKKELCPAAFYTILPFYPAAPHGEKGAGLCISCADYCTDIVFSLGGGDPGSFFGECDAYGDIAVRVEGARGGGTGSPREGTEYPVNALIDAMRIPCFSALAAAFPYMRTLERGGSLGFLTRDRDAAGIQCPNPSVRVRMFVRRDRATGSFRLDVHGRDGVCPKNLQPGRSYPLPPLEGGALPLRLLATLYPYIMRLKADAAGAPRTVRCPVEAGAADVRVFRGRG
ncbi:MAG: TIGR04076 family protein [Chlamydiae bacterium]|nr:TIGR04076 family protein [Chlamydiota bacterium]